MDQFYSFELKAPSYVKTQVVNSYYDFDLVLPSGTLPSFKIPVVKIYISGTWKITPLKIYL